MELILIAAMSSNRVIGRNNTIPWQSINVILSNDNELQIPVCNIADSMTEAIHFCQDQEKSFIIGGQSIFRESLALADTILLSVLDKEYEGDTFFPPIPKKHFQKISEKRMGHAQPFTLLTYQRKTET
jgi:dihydrofolate reductase